MVPPLRPSPNQSVEMSEPITVPLLDLKAQYATIREEIRAAVDAVLESQQCILGPAVTECEAKLAALLRLPARRSPSPPAATPCW